MAKPRKPFLFLDGEGGDCEDGSHAYMVLCGYSDYTGEIMLRNTDGSPLSTVQILDWLLNLNARLCEEEQPHTFVGFGFEYDKAMWLKDLPKVIANRLMRPEIVGWMDPKRHIPKPVIWGPYMFHRMGSEFSVAETTFGIFARATKEDRRSFKVWDIWRFYQGSFVKALKAWQVLPDDELEQMEKMKAKRSTFRADEIDEEIIRYCLSECRAGVQLIAKLDATCVELGYPLRRYDGAGSLASAMMKAWDITKYQAPPKKVMIDPVSRAYFGGRFEIAAHGRVPDLVIQYDICSAYPHIIQNLPCLACGDWKRSTDLQEEGLYEVMWELPENTVWGCLPYRSSNGEISFPRTGRGWYWGVEVIAARRIYPSGFTVLQGWRFIRKCDHRPYGHVPEVYAERKRLGKSAKGMILKLGLNSLYGKNVQTVGKPKYANYIWGGMITSGTRAMLLDAIGIASDPAQIIGTATDAIYSLEPLDLPIGNQLGEWECTPIEGGCLIIQPGIMIAYDVIGKGKYKTRGIANRVFAGVAHVAEERWDTLGVFGSFTAKSHRFLGLKGALSRGKYENRCRWIDIEQSLSFMPVTKRRLPDSELTAYRSYRASRSFTITGCNELSAPYRRIKLVLEQFGDSDEFEVPADECERLEVTAYAE